METQERRELAGALVTAGLEIKATHRPDRWTIVRRDEEGRVFQAVELRMSRRRFERFVGQRDHDAALLAALIDEEMSTSDSEVSWIAIVRSWPFPWILGVASDRAPVRAVSS